MSTRIRPPATATVETPEASSRIMISLSPPKRSVAPIADVSEIPSWSKLVLAQAQRMSGFLWQKAMKKMPESMIANSDACFFQPRGHCTAWRAAQWNWAVYLKSYNLTERELHFSDYLLTSSFLLLTPKKCLRNT